MKKIALLFIFLITISALIFVLGGQSSFVREGLSRVVTLNKVASLKDVKTGFGFAEVPHFKVEVPEKNKEKIGKAVKKTWETKAEKIEAEITFKADGEKIPVVIEKTDQGEFQIAIDEASQKEFRRGDYKLKVTAKESFAYERNLTQDFSWGVLAVNTNKSVFKPGETSQISFGVLNKHGSTICNAKIEITIVDPDSNEKKLSYKNGDIKTSDECGNNYSEKQDYLTSYRVGKAGRYFMQVVADNGDGKHSITDFFDVREAVPFVIERKKFPTRIYPASGYPVEIKITANEDYKGKVFDTVPKSFVITDISNGGTHKNRNIELLNLTQEEKERDLEIYKGNIPKLAKTLWENTNDIKKADNHTPNPITWNVDWKKGKTYTLSYTINFPAVSPEYYLIGPFIVGEHPFDASQGNIDPESDSKAIVMNNKILENDPDIEFFEVRQWQVASDATRCWAGTVDANWNTSLNWVSTTGTAVTLANGDVATFDSSTTTCSSGSTNNASTIAAARTVQAVSILTYTNTITQSNGADLTITVAAGWNQASSTSTFTGGDSTSDIIMGTVTTSDFTLSNGTFNAPGGIITVPDNFTVSGGTFNANSGTVNIDPPASGTSTLTGSVTLYNLFYTGDNASIANVASGSTVTVDNLLTLQGTNNGCNFCSEFDGPGAISLKGNLTSTQDGAVGDLIITLNGTGDQTITGGSCCQHIPGLTINKSSGTLNLVSEIYLTADLTYIKGNYNAGTSTLGTDQDVVDATINITGSMAINNFYVFGGNGDDLNITSGTTLLVRGNATFDGCCNNFYGSINGPGSLIVEGNFTTLNQSLEGDLAITLAGSQNQTITQSTDNSKMPSGTFTIAKKGGQANLATNLVINESGQDLTITSGVLNVGNFNLTVNDTLTVNGQLSQGTGNVTTGASGEVVVGSTGIWMNNSTGDVTIGASGDGFANSGFVQLDGNGPTDCDSTNAISIATTTATTQRTWSGSGTYRLVDLTVRDAGGSLTAYHSTNTSNNGWTFDSSCPAYSNRSSTSITGGITILGGTSITSN